MSLIRCPDCSQEVSNRAVACPKCGYPTSELTSLPEAASKNDLQLVHDVLKAGADVNDKDARGQTALLIASRNGNLEIAKTLIDAGARTEESAMWGITPLMQAASHGHGRLVQLLLNSGADPLVRNENGESAIDLARKKRQKSTAFILQEKIIPLVQAKGPGFEPQELSFPTKDAENHFDSSARLLTPKKMVTPPAESQAVDILCLHCNHGIMPEDLQCPGCKTPIIRRYCRCSRLIPDHVLTCPYCNTQKQARFRYIRRMESIVVGSVTALVIGLLLLSAWSKPEEAHGKDAIHISAQQSIPSHLKQNDQLSSAETKSTPAIQQTPIVTKKVEPIPVTSNSYESQPLVSAQAHTESPVDESDPEVQEKEVRSLRAATHLNDLGFRLMQVGRYNEAVQVLEQALESFPPGRTRNIAYAWTLYNLGRSLRLAGHPDLAIPVLEKRMNYTDQRETVARELQEARREAGDSMIYE